MTIYELLYVMDNMSRDIVVQNDALLDYTEGDKAITKFEGEIYDFRVSDLYDEIQNEEVTDLYTLSDGRLVICYYDEDECTSNEDEDYASNAPCDLTGFCAGTSCSRYWECNGGK